LLNIYQLSIPTPYEVGLVNTYLIKNEPYTLVDAGAGIVEARESLVSQLKKLKVNIENIKRVILTHSHLDHSGQALYIREVSGADIFIHPYEQKKLAGENTFLKERKKILKGTGTPEEVWEEIFRDIDYSEQPVLKESEVVHVDEGYIFEFDGGKLETLHMPGHATGHICLYDSGESNFLSGDFLLPHITPNPIVEQDPEKPGQRVRTLRQYLSGLERLEKMQIARVWPGHGEAIDNFRQVIENARRHHTQRLKTVYDIINSNGSKTIYETARVLYPNIKGFNVLLGLSEVAAHMDYLCDEGKIVAEEKNGVIYYYVSQ